MSGANAEQFVETSTEDIIIIFHLLESMFVDDVRVVVYMDHRTWVINCNVQFGKCCGQVLPVDGVECEFMEEWFVAMLEKHRPPISSLVKGEVAEPFF